MLSLAAPVVLQNGPIVALLVIMNCARTAVCRASFLPEHQFFFWGFVFG